MLTTLNLDKKFDVVDLRKILYCKMMATQAGIHSQVKIFYDGHKEPQTNHLEKFKDHINWLRITDSDFDYIDLTRTNQFLEKS